MSRRRGIPTGWSEVALGDVATEYSVRVDNPAKSEFERFVGSNHIGRFELTVSNWGSTSEVTSAMKRFQPGDYLLVRRSLYASDFRERAARADFGGVCSGDILTIRERKEVIAPGYLSVVLNNPELWAYVVAHATGSITRRIKWRQLQQYKFFLPPVHEQARVWEAMEASWRTISVTTDLLARLRTLRAALVLAATGGPESPNSPLSSKPMVRLGDVANVVRGSTPRPAGDKRYFGGSHIPWITVGEITKDDKVYLESTETCLTELGERLSRRVPKGTVVLSNSGWTLGVPKILRISGCANDGVAAFLDLDPKIDPLFLFYRLFGMTEYLRNVVAAGGDQPNLNTERIAQLTIPLCTLAEQRNAVAQVKDVQAAIDKVKGRSTEQRELHSQLAASVHVYGLDQ